MTGSDRSEAAIVLAGGRATRLGGADKPGLVIDGAALLDTVLGAVSDVPERVIVGPQTLQRDDARVVRESPEFGGPAAALCAGVAAIEPVVWVWVLACDLPRAKELVDLIRAQGLESGGADRESNSDSDSDSNSDSNSDSDSDSDGTIVVDTDGRDQWLAARYRYTSLASRCASVSDSSDLSMRSLLAPLTLQRVVDRDGASVDLDTWDDITRYTDRTETH